MKWPEFVDEAKHAWRMFSMQCMGAALAIQLTWSQIPDDLKQAIPHRWVEWITSSLLVLGMVGRLFKQNLPGDQK